MINQNENSQVKYQERVKTKHRFIQGKLSKVGRDKMQNLKTPARSKKKMRQEKGEHEYIRKGGLTDK